MIRLSILSDDAAQIARIGRRLSNAELVSESDKHDAIVITASANTSEEQCRRMLDADKSVLMLLPNIVDEKLVALGRKFDGKLFFGNVKRFLPTIATIKDVLEGGQLGEPGLLRLHRWDCSSSDRSLAEKLFVEVDLAAWLFDQVPTEIYAVGDQERPYAQIHLGFPDGGMALIDVAVAPTNAPYNSASLIGSTGAAYGDDHHNSQLLFCDNNVSAVTTTQGDTAMLHQLQAFVDFLLDGVQSITPIEDVVRAQLITREIMASLNDGKVRCWAGGKYEVV